MTPEQHKSLLKLVAISFDEFEDWIHQNTPQQWMPEDTKDLLAYMGYIQFQMYQHSIPGVTLEQLATVFFGSKEESKDMLSLITQGRYQMNH